MRLKHFLNRIRTSVNEQPMPLHPSLAPDHPFRDWTREHAIDEYEARVSALQYTIGEKERAKALLALAAKRAKSGPADDMADLLDTIFDTRAERWQDAFAQLWTGKVCGGYFVEFGACDGLAASNTYHLEKCFGWKGILAEPARAWHDKLHENRSSIIDLRCVSSTTGQNMTFYESRTPVTSSLSRTHRYIGEIKQSYDVSTVSLTDLLDEHHAPKHIDFLSVDTEGHELDALQNFAFDRYSFGFICVEQHVHLDESNDVTDLLRRAGYEIAYPRNPNTAVPPHMQVSGDDLYFVPEDHPFLDTVSEV